MSCNLFLVSIIQIKFIGRAKVIHQTSSSSGNNSMVDRTFLFHHSITPWFSFASSARVHLIYSLCFFYLIIQTGYGGASSTGRKTDIRWSHNGAGRCQLIESWPGRPAALAYGWRQRWIFMWRIAFLLVTFCVCGGGGGVPPSLLLQTRKKWHGPEFKEVHLWATGDLHGWESEQTWATQSIWIRFMIKRDAEVGCGGSFGEARGCLIELEIRWRWAVGSFRPIQMWDDE